MGKGAGRELLEQAHLSGGPAFSDSSVSADDTEALLALLDQTHADSGIGSVSAELLGRYQLTGADVTSFVIGAKEPTPKTVYLIADCEGDVGKAQLALRAGGLIDESGAWCAPAGTVLVQLGDVIDRGTGSITLCLYLTDLAVQAERAGSKVELILGNHELFMAAAGSGDSYATAIWCTNGGLTVLEEAERLGLLAEAESLYSLFTRTGGVQRIRPALIFGISPEIESLFQGLARLLYGGFADRFDGSAILNNEYVPASDVLHHGLLAPYLQRVRPFLQLGELFFAHGGVSNWLVDAATSENGLVGLHESLAAVWRDPEKRTRTLLGRNAFFAIGASRGGPMLPQETSLFWLDFEKEQRQALKQESLRDFLRSNGIKTAFFGHTPGKFPRRISAGATELTPVVSLRGSATKPAQLIGVELEMYGLDCALRSDTLNRPHLYRWDSETRSLRFFAQE